MIVQDHTYTSFPRDRIIAAMKGSVEDDLSFTRDNLIMRRSKDGGEYYLMCIFTNRYRDRDVHSAPHKGGEILSGDAHAKYMSILDANPDMAPQLWSLHIPGTERKNRAHWWDYDGHFCYAEFKLDTEEASGISAFVKEYTPGLSHGFFVLKYDEKEAVIEEYFTYEISILPLEWAANQWTTIEMTRKELEMKLSPERRAALVKLHGEDFVKGIETKGDSMLKLLQDLDVEMKSFQPEKETEPAAEKKVEKTASAEVSEDSPVTQAEVVAAMETLHKAVGADIAELSKNIEKLYDVVKELSADVYERITELSTSDTDRLAAKAAAAPISIIANWMPKSVIGSEETKVPANSKLLNGPQQNGNGLTTQEALNIFSGFTSGVAEGVNRGN